jgi:hypothetical protein
MPERGKMGAGSGATSRVRQKFELPREAQTTYQAKLA